jgi:hypothetical protein
MARRPRTARLDIEQLLLADLPTAKPLAEGAARQG